MFMPYQAAYRSGEENWSDINKFTWEWSLNKLYAIRASQTITDKKVFGYV